MRTTLLSLVDSEGNLPCLEIGTRLGTFLNPELRCVVKGAWRPDWDRWRLPIGNESDSDEIHWSTYIGNQEDTLASWYLAPYLD